MFVLPTSGGRETQIIRFSIVPETAPENNNLATFL
jgi:hypothetical protein